MPGGDRTGPRGMGAKTGRGAGFCAGFEMPGFMNSGSTRGINNGDGRRRRVNCGGRRYRKINFRQATAMAQETFE